MSALAAHGAPVPAAFALSTVVYAEFARSIGLPMRACEADDADLASIRAGIEDAPLPPFVTDLLRQGWETLTATRAVTPSLAVRSSATSEDSAEYSFAGLHDTVLDVRDLPGLECAVRRCWASLWSDRSVDYRRRKGLDAETAEIAVVVQELIPSDVSFVVFTADPVGGNDDHLVIAATWGLGEAVVSGLVVPDHIVIGPSGGVIEYTPGEKLVMIIPGGTNGGGAREAPVPRVLQSAPVLTQSQAIEIGKIARRISARLGFKADIEGAIAGGTVYLLQARPITTLPPASLEH